MEGRVCPYLIAKNSSILENIESTDELVCPFSKRSSFEEISRSNDSKQEEPKKDKQEPKRKLNDEKEIKKRLKKSKTEQSKEKKYKHHNYPFHGEEWTMRNAEEKIQCFMERNNRIRNTKQVGQKRQIATSFEIT